MLRLLSLLINPRFQKFPKWELHKIGFIILQISFIKAVHLIMLIPHLKAKKNKIKSLS